MSSCPAPSATAVRDGARPVRRRALGHGVHEVHGVHGAPRARRSLRVLLVAALGSTVLAGCASAVPVPAAPHAADPRCAEVVLALPQELEGLPRLRTTSQATVAWGDPAQPVVLRCGVEPPGPTTQACVTADDGAGTAVDWVTVTGPEQEGGGAEWTFTTYGRVPAVEVVVPAAVTAERSTSFVLDLGPAVSLVEQERRCL